MIYDYGNQPKLAGSSSLNHFSNSVLVCSALLYWCSRS